MKATDLIYIGIKGSVIALHRATGQQAWNTHLKGSSFVNVVAHEGKIYATTYGEVFCLDPLTGSGLWHNELSGYGWGLSTIAMTDLPVGSSVPPILQEHRRQEEASSSSTTTATTSTSY